MVDTYREMEQAGARVTVHPDHICVVKGKWTRRYYADGHRTISGPARFVVDIEMTENKPEPLWRWLWKTLTGNADGR